LHNNYNARPIEILLVEDSPSDADLTMESFSDSKVINNLHLVVDGMEALDFLYKRGKHTEAVRPDLILLDLNLPKKNGMEVLEEIKENRDLKTIPVVILTTSSAEQDILKSYKLHANSYMTKPVDFEQFVLVIKSIENFWLAAVKLPSKV
jgi:two-component system, chemotaxis family, response regulator Rcp1